MTGTQVIVQGADFSGLGLGSVNPIENFITNGAITNTSDKAALRAFWASMEAAGLDEKFDVLRIFCSATVQSDKLNIMQMSEDSDAANRAVFINDDSTAHTVDGWQGSSSASRRIHSNYSIANILTFHMHCFNKTSETGGGSASKFLMGFNDNSGGNNVFVALQRNHQGSTRGTIDKFDSVSFVSAYPYDTTKTGLLSIARNANDTKLYDGGTVIATETKTITPTINGTGKMIEGSLDDTSPSIQTDAKIRLFAYGVSSWSDADEAAFNTICNTLNTAL